MGEHMFRNRDIINSETVRFMRAGTGVYYEEADMARQARQSCETQCYHVIARGVGKQIIYETEEDYRFFHINNLAAETHLL